MARKRNPNRRERCSLLVAGPAALNRISPAGFANTPAVEMPKVLMPIGDATEALDTFYPFFRIAEDGFRVVVAGPEARLYHTVLHEIPPNSDIPWDITQERPGYHIKAEIAFRDVDPSEYAGLFVSGGRAPEYLRYNKDLLKITRHFFETNKPVMVDGNLVTARVWADNTPLMKEFMKMLNANRKDAGNQTNKSK